MLPQLFVCLFPFSWSIFFCPFTFSLCVSFSLKWVSSTRVSSTRGGEGLVLLSTQPPYVFSLGHLIHLHLKYLLIDVYLLPFLLFIFFIFFFFLNKTFNNEWHVPHWELNQWPFSSQAGTYSTEPHQSGLNEHFWFLQFYITSWL